MSGRDAPDSLGSAHARLHARAARRGERAASVRAPPGATANPLVDAYMYINRPGYSACACNGGPLAVGTWWPERALMYAQYGTDWLSPPAGTKYGHFKRYSLRQLGAFG